MKVYIHMKTPDAVNDAIEEMVEDGEEMQAKARKLLEQYFQYGECCTVVVDMTNETVTLQKVK